MRDYAPSQFVPDSCQIGRGATGNSGELTSRRPGAAVIPPQVNRAASPRSPLLPKLMVYRPP